MPTVNPSFIMEDYQDIVTEEGAFRVMRRANLLNNEVYFAAYEPMTMLGSHHVYKKDDDGWWGNVCERKLSAELDKRFEGLPERREAVGAYYRANQTLARRIIIQAFPEASQGTNITGAIVLVPEVFP